LGASCLLRWMVQVELCERMNAGFGLQIYTFMHILRLA
jgi:hypothetical protein